MRQPAFTETPRRDAVDRKKTIAARDPGPGCRSVGVDTAHESVAAADDGEHADRSNHPRSAPADEPYVAEVQLAVRPLRIEVTKFGDMTVIRYANLDAATSAASGNVKLETALRVADGNVGRIIGEAGQRTSQREVRLVIEDVRSLI